MARLTAWALLVLLVDPFAHLAVSRPVASVSVETRVDLFVRAACRGNCLTTSPVLAVTARIGRVRDRSGAESFLEWRLRF